MSTPNPGSPEAVERGCICPVIDNGYGQGAWGGKRDEDGELLFWRTLDCSLHGAEVDAEILAMREGGEG